MRPSPTRSPPRSRGHEGKRGRRTGRLPFILLLAAVLTWPVSVLLLAYLSRRVRAVGPLVLVFMTLSLVSHSIGLVFGHPLCDAVLMDLRGFSRQNAGCVFEIQELARLVPLGRAVFVVDGRTDEQLLARTLGGSRAGVFRLGSTEGKKERGLKDLLRALAAAAAPAPTSTATA